MRFFSATRDWIVMATMTGTRKQRRHGYYNRQGDYPTGYWPQSQSER